VERVSPNGPQRVKGPDDLDGEPAGDQGGEPVIMRVVDVEDLDPLLPENGQKGDEIPDNPQRHPWV